MKKNFRFLNSKGFTLAEIMVATGMLAVISLGVMQLMSNMNRGQKEFEQNAEIRSILNNIEVSLQDTNTCNYSLVVNKYIDSGNTGFYKIDDIAAANINTYSQDVLVDRIINPNKSFFTVPADEGNILGLNLADDITVARMCNEDYTGGMSADELREYGCMIGNDKGRILIRRMWLGTDSGGNTSLFITFISGGLINVFTSDPSTDLQVYYNALRASDPEAAAKLSGSFGSPIVTKFIRISLSSVSADQVAPMNNMTAVSRITDPAGSLAEGDVTNCFTNLTDTIQAACENFGGNYHDIDGSCRALRIRSDNSSNDGEAGYDASFIPSIPTNAVSPGGPRSTAIATEGHVYVGPLNNTGAAESVGGNLWASGVGIIGSPSFNVEPDDGGDNQGELWTQSHIRVGSKASGTAGDHGNIYADGGLVLGTATTDPADNSGHIYSNGGIALGTTSGTALTGPHMKTSGGLSLGTANQSPDDGHAMISGGAKIGSLAAGAAMSDDDLAVTGGISVGASGSNPYSADPDDGSVYAQNSYYGAGSLHLGSQAVNPSAGAGHIRISGALNVGATQTQTDAGTAHIQGIAYSYGLDPLEDNINALTTIEWVKERIARTLAPTGSSAAQIAEDILSNAVKDTKSGIVAIQKDACENFYVKNNNQNYVAGSWKSGTKRCEFNNNARDCSIDGQCTNVYANNAVISDNYMRATGYIRAGSYVRADTYLVTGTYAQIGSYLNVGGNVTATGRVHSSNYVFATNYLQTNGYARAARFCINGTSGASCITKVKSNVCGNTQKVVSWQNGHVICINEARHY
ncbi:putative membrane protein [Halobacteriovorax marinus SJ]|uniref:Membrane protein n=1 Tax=Halobacteriovorax marinus (strain ATCC BAA-682 / DSM 15412 / SJ) TaxID=862908 RepID=E1WZV4_HALMS|nr:prepilin-type N-terminal cleavage/methylation domain-containing protein [Halobacteriovorax marinus]CBW27890.1 putative membrane protein [Halobacteriovorax marinus SJ]